MNGLGAFGTYRNGLSSLMPKNGAAKAGKNERQGNASKTNRSGNTKKMDSTTPVQLSDRAKALLEELKKTYTNMDFMVANYETEEEAQAYLSRGTKEYSVLIDPETLEEMAASEETKQKYLGILEEATSNLGALKEKLEEEGTVVKTLGVTIGKDGSVSYFAEVEKATERQRDRIEKAQEKKAEEKKEEKRKEAKDARESRLHPEEPEKSVRVKASSIEELLEKIRGIDWNSVQPSTEKTGSRFNLTV